MAEPAEARVPFPSFAWRLGFLYAALFLVVGCYLPYLPIWLHWRDLDADQIAVLLATPLFIRILFTPAISFAADLLGGRRAILIALAWGSLVSFLLLWAADGFWQMLLATALLAINWTTIMPLIETVAVAGIRSGALDYGRVRLWGSLSFIVASLGSGLLIGTLGAETVLPLLLAGTALMVLGAHLLPRELADRAPLAASGLRRLKLADAFELVRAPLFLLILLAASMVQASHALYYSFGSLHWRAQGIPDGVIGALWSVGVVAEIALFAASGRVIASIGTTRLLMLDRACGNLALGADGDRSAVMGDGAAADAPRHELRRGSPRGHPFHDPCRAGGSRRHRPRPLCRRRRGPRTGRSHHRFRPALPDLCRRSLRRHGLPCSDRGGMRLSSHAALARRAGGGSRRPQPQSSGSGERTWPAA
jgi:MFS family permease